jgi:hypothetical protein
LAFGPLGRCLLKQGKGRGHWSGRLGNLLRILLKTLFALLGIDQYRLYRIWKRGLRGRFGLKLPPLLLLLLSLEAGVGLAGPFQRLSVGIGGNLNRLFLSLFWTLTRNLFRSWRRGC